jgi:hypothetical protein
VLVALAFVVSSRVEDNVAPPPLELSSVGARADGPGTVLVGVLVRNVGDRGVEVLDVAVPEVDSARAGTGTNARTIPIAPRDTAQFLIRLPARCPDRPKFDHLRVQVRVDGREIQQTLPIDLPVELDCS